MVNDALVPFNFRRLLHSHLSGLVWSNGLAKGYCGFLLCVYTCDRHVTYEEVCSQLINSSYSTCHLSGLQQHVQPKHPPIYVYVISYLYPLTLSVAKLYSCEANSTVVVVTVLTTNCL